MKVEIHGKQLSIYLFPLKSKENKEYILLDTGCVLNLLKRLRTVMHRIENSSLKLAILEHTIYEVMEHLSKSRSSMIKQGISVFGLYNTMENFRKILPDDKIRKVRNPANSKEIVSDFKKFGEDSILAFAIYECGFKAVATQDRKLAEKIG